ncbi:EthD family reductase [Microbacterium aerolatum]|uniref:EthD family reductase n=1 Tax=Microbacterium aerolatum TaxID=153731 RepID=UPI0020019F5D|nr:EthD family reductase [Microbacterium aerolatum]MCK3769479.1 EthD family reductase [Microbacterium aerolatum]
MYRVIVVIRRKSKMTREEFLEHWLVDHPAFVERLPRVRAYRQSPAIEHRKEWPFDGMAELCFDSLADVARAFDGIEARELFAHEQDFIEDATWFIAEEGRDVPLKTVLSKE